MLFMVRANSNEIHLKSSDFGDKESGQNINRCIKWTRKVFINNLNVNPRINVLKKVVI